MVINSFLKYKTKSIENTNFTIQDIEDAKKVLFVLLTRYGDTIISLEIIKEFINLYPNKKYLVLVPKQMVPYVKELIPNLDVIAVNKRNIIDMIKVNLLLKREQFDLAFNPWSNGLDSCYFVSYAKKFLCYKSFIRPEVINHYEVVRSYLKLPPKTWNISELTLKDNYQNILICPESTDSQRSIEGKQLDELILKLKQIYPNASYVIAAMNEKYLKKGYQKFLFKKSAKSSQDFITLVKNSDLICCSDSGPLHIALSLKKDTIALFNITKPEVVVNADVTLKVNL